jgi:WD40 repeat protein
MTPSFFRHSPPGFLRWLRLSLTSAPLLCLLQLLTTTSADAQSRPLIRWMQGGEVTGLQQALLTPDGKTFLTSSDALLLGDQNIHVHSALDGATLRSIRNTTAVQTMALSPDGSKVVEGLVNNAYDVRRVSDGATVLTLPDGIGQRSALDWTPDGSRIIAGNDLLQVLNAVDGSLIAAYPINTVRIRSLAVSPDGKRVVFVGNNNKVYVSSLTDGTLLQTFTGQTKTVTAVAFSPDNRTVASASLDGTIDLWDSVGGTLLRTLTTGVANYAVAFSPVGSVVVTGSIGSRLDLWNVAGGQLLRETTLGPSASEIISLSYSKDGAQLLAADEHCEFRLYNPDLSVLRPLPSEHTQSISGIGITPDSARVVSVADADYNLNIWNLATGRQKRAIPNGTSSSPTRREYLALAVSPDGMSFATTDSDRFLRVWRTSDGALALDASIDVQSHAIAWSRDGSRLFVEASTATGIAIRSAASGSLLGILPGTTSGTEDIAVSPDGQLLASGDRNGTVQMWRLSDSTLLNTFTGHTDFVNAVAFSPDSALLLSGSSDTTAILRNVADGSIVHTFTTGEEISNVAVAPDGKTLATGSFTHLRLWKVFDGSLLNDYTDEVAGLRQNTLAYSPDNSTLVYGREDTTVVAAANPYWIPTISLALNPLTVISGVSSTGTVTIAHPAPAGGVTVALQSDNGVATLSTYSLTIPEGATSADFTIHTTPLPGAVNVTLTANNSVSAGVVTLTVLPHLASDFNNDGLSDLVLQNESTNLIVVWFTSVLNILGGSSVSYLPPTGWKVVGAADFSGTGNSDLMLQNQTTGKVVVWYLMGTTVGGSAELSFQPGAGYKVVGIGDFNNDGKPDVLFQHQSTGQLVVWYLNGATVTGGVSIPQVPSGGATVVGVGDFSQDGKPDILLQNPTTHQLSVWTMDGVQFVSQLPITSVPDAAWQVRSITDTNGDGKPDLVFQNQTTNQLLVWFMDGLAYSGGGTMSLTPMAGYLLRGPH